MATILDWPVVPRTSNELLRARETPATIRRQLDPRPKPGVDTLSPAEAKIISERKELLLLELGVLEGCVNT